MSALTLPPGTSLLQLSLKTPVEDAVIEEALAMMGFDEAIFDADEEEQTYETTRSVLARSALAILVDDAERVRWTCRHPLAAGVDPLALAPSPPPAEGFQLRRGARYDLFFAVWLKMHGGRRAIVEALESMKGFEVERTFCVKRFMRFPDRPGADGALWLAVATWTGPDSIVTDQDPLFFYALAESRS